VTWAWLPPLQNARMKKRERNEAIAGRALADLARWLDSAPLAGVAAPPRGDEAQVHAVHVA